MRVLRRLLIAGLAAALAGPAGAQDFDPNKPAKQYFGAHTLPSAAAGESFGSYARGCLAGGVQLPETGPTWQAMRLSRNRNWGHPELIAFLHRLGGYAQDAGWPGIYVGDMSQPRGGPMRTGHRSHQIGLDADIWMRRPVGRALSTSERERIGSYVVVASDGVNMNSNWSPSHHQVLKAAASDPAVARIFVNAAIKRALCANEPPGDREWLSKIRPWRGHDAHFHVRLRCPPDSPGCQNQGAPAPGDGCGADLAKWFKGLEPEPETEPEPTLGATRAITRGVSREITLNDLPPACSAVLADGAGDGAGGGTAGGFGTGYVADPSTMIHLPQGVILAYAGTLGTKYFWPAPVRLDPPLIPHVKLEAEGDLPPGVFFVDRGEGFGVLKGVPTQAGTYGLDITLSYAGKVVATMPVGVDIRQGAAGTGPPPDDPVERVKTFVEEFSGGPCFFADTAAVGDASAQVLAFGMAAEPMHALDADFKAVFGYEARIIGQLITEPQCDALNLFESVPKFGGIKPDVAMDRFTLTVGETMSGRISGLDGRAVTLLLVDDKGEVRDLAGYLTEEEGGTVSFGVPVNRRGPHIVLAVATPSAVEAPDSSEPVLFDRFFDGFLLRVMRYNFGYRLTYRYVLVN